jgi:heptosyltransferase-2
MASELERRSGDPCARPAGRWEADGWRGPLLVVRLSSLGDVILTTGPLRLLRRRRPDLAIDFLTRAAYAPLLQGSPLVDRLRIADEHEEQPLDEARRYATALDWQGGERGRRAALRFAPGARRRGAPRAALRRRLLVLWGRRLTAPPGYAARLAASLVGAPVARRWLAPQIEVSAEARRAIEAGLGRCGGTAQVVIAAGASRPLKAIPQPLAAALARRLRERGDRVIRLRLPGDSGEPRRRAGSRNRSGGEARLDRDATGEVSFRGALPEVAALLAAADLLIASDSGILHLATAVGTPALGLFGPTSPELGFSPLGTGRALGVDLACRPCHIHGPRFCWLGHRRCWGDFTVEGILAAADALRGERRCPVPTRPAADEE